MRGPFLRSDAVFQPTARSFAPNSLLNQDWQRPVSGARKEGPSAIVLIDQDDTTEGRPVRDIASQLLPRMTPEEEEGPLGELKAAIAAEPAGGFGEPGRCPLCGCPRFARKGRGAGGSRRRLCRGRARTFSAKTGSLLAASKLGPAAWMAFAERMAGALSLRETARRCGVSLCTSWFMRMRVCEVMSRLLLPARRGTFHLDGTLVADSLSGNHRRSPALGMPRRPYRNGRDRRRRARGRSKERVVVECGVNECGDCFCDAIDRGSAGAGELALRLSRHVPEASTLATDGHPSYAFAASGWEHRVVDPKDPSTGDVNMVNALHSRLKGFLAPFRGVATRRLRRHPDWFCCRERFKRSDMDRRRLLYEHEAAGTYWMTRRLTHQEIGNLMVYWTRQYARNVNPGLT